MPFPIDARRKGGQNVPLEKRQFVRDRELARHAGRKGGLACQARKRERKQEPIP